MEKLQSNINPFWIVIVGVIAGLVPVIGFMFNIPEISVFPLVLIAIWLAFVHPLTYVIIIATLVPLSIQVNDIGGGFGLSLPTEPMMIIFFGILLLRFFVKGEIDLKFLKHPIILIAVLYLTWYFVTTLTSTMFFVSIKSFASRFWYIAIFLLFLAPNLKSKKMMKYLLYGLIAGGTIMVVFTLIKHGREGFVRLHSYTIMRPFFADHGSYAAFLAMFTPILFVFGLLGHKFNISVFLRIVFSILFFIFLTGILFSFTRAAWMSIAGVMALTVAVHYGITFKQMLIGLFFFIGIISWKHESILSELSRNKQDSAERLEDHMKSVSNISTDPSNMERINRWNCAVAMVKDKPVFGFGPYTYTFQYAPYQRPEQMTRISTNAGTLGNAHSEYFMALAEMGYIGALLVIALFMSSLYVGMKLYNNAAQGWVRILAAAIMLGLMTYYIHGLINNYSEYDKISVPLWSFLAILTALDLYHAKYKEPKQIEDGESNPS